MLSREQEEILEHFGFIIREEEIIHKKVRVRLTAQEVSLYKKADDLKEFLKDKIRGK
jgi:hypothetical protein